MKISYSVSPVDCQPQWPQKPEPIVHPWRECLLATGALCLAVYVVGTGLYAAYLLASS